MAFPQRHFYTPETSFTPLFRLLDDFDNYSRPINAQQQGRRSGLMHWQPKFDMRETNSAYELHGELPGTSKENVNVEFTDPQNMLISGKIERTYTSGTPPAGTLEGIASRGKIAEGGEGQAKTSSREATAEDATEDTAKYWLTERSIGEFSRNFSFPTRVNQENVTASFKDGILNITVPKAAKHESRRITVN
ncbi:hsp20/alpha crystallin family domain-containing protein [Trichoderma breve]|uniref:Hsp20/alpha crystallin family domain-containing protein n=1 Tax=Trichoderma breve TaxID=2034170 RepID=A0A9W9E4E9_9HYPO|nr:hsp20/alpha crystallin family domain-containing protein [Trichoderma breve]KAJ4856955.1 hsp20/alpha crystallin family domain-containing protein [Trichoderma breve]